MSTGFDEFYREIEAEAKAEGPAAVADLRAKELKYQLINSLLTRRRQLHWTQGDLAAKSGVTQEEISRIERGRKSPNMDTYARLASVMDLGVVVRRPRQRRIKVAQALRRRGHDSDLTAVRVTPAERRRTE